MRLFNALLALFVFMTALTAVTYAAVHPSPVADDPPQQTTERPTSTETDSPTTETHTPTPTPVGTEGPCVTVSAANNDTVCP